VQEERWRVSRSLRKCRLQSNLRKCNQTREPEGRLALGTGRLEERWLWVLTGCFI
jgi:hypothetical protein